jgi:hypothetical protein
MAIELGGFDQDDPPEARGDEKHWLILLSLCILLQMLSRDPKQELSGFLERRWDGLMKHVGQPVAGEGPSPSHPTGELEGVQDSRKAANTAQASMERSKKEMIETP